MAWFVRSLGTERVGEFLPVAVIQSFPIGKGGGKGAEFVLEVEKKNALGVLLVASDAF